MEKPWENPWNELVVNRPNPYQWDVSGHKGTIKINYTLFANHGDGTYSQVDETHAHLNVPATFIYSPEYEKSPIQIKLHPRKDLNWKVATQLKQLSEYEYFAPDPIPEDRKDPWAFWLYGYRLLPMARGPALWAVRKLTCVTYPVSPKIRLSEAAMFIWGQINKVNPQERTLKPLRLYLMIRR